MISLTATNYLKEKIGSKYRFYRLFFNFVALTTLIPVLQYGAGLRGQVIFRWDGFLLVFQLILGTVALFLFASGALKYDILEFFGIRQTISGNSHPTLSKNGNVETSGVLNLTRHPWYLATIIFIWVSFRDMYVSTLLVNIILTVYIVIGTVLEERKLITEYGDNYRDYQKRVSMLFPFKWLFSRISKIKFLTQKGLYVFSLLLFCCISLLIVLSSF
jgi:protein-S-isoprenylcysteine O-methyltransferase Ste14